MTTATPQESPEARPRATYRDVLDAPAHRVAEIVDGVLYTNPRPAAPHALASSRIGYSLTGPFDIGRGGPGGWWIVFEPELHLGDDILVPDLAGWRRTRMPRYPETAYFTLAPDWCARFSRHRPADSTSTRNGRCTHESRCATSG